MKWSPAIFMIFYDYLFLCYPTKLNYIAIKPFNAIMSHTQQIKKNWER